MKKWMMKQQGLYILPVVCMFLWTACNEPQTGESFSVEIQSPAADVSVAPGEELFIKIKGTHPEGLHEVGYILKSINSGLSLSAAAEHSHETVLVYETTWTVPADYTVPDTLLLIGIAADHVGNTVKDSLYLYVE